MEEVLKNENIHPNDKNIIFYEEDHRYEIITDPNNRYTSVTTWIHLHFKKFDADKVIENMMKGKKWGPDNKYWGLSKTEIKELWNNNGKQQSQLGTNLHFNIECFMNNSILKTKYKHKDLLQYYNSSNIQNENTCIEWQYFINFIKSTPDFVPFRTEWIVYDTELKLAGSVDMVYINDDGTINIYDWKRSKEIKRVSYTNEFSTTPCIAEIPDTNFWHYSLQLNIYKYILEKNYDHIVKDLFLVILHPDSKENNFELIKVPDLTLQVTRLFHEKHLNNNL